jgi:WD40 repeat protein
MTSHKHFKALVRARAAATGKPYTAARAELLAESANVRTLLVTTIDAHDRHGMVVRSTPDGSELLSGGFGGQLRIWRSADGARVGEFVGHTSSVNDLALTADGGRLLSASSDGTIRIWDVATRTAIDTVASFRRPAVTIDLALDGRYAVSGGYDGMLRIHGLTRGIDDRAVRVGDRVASVAVHPDGERIAVATGTPTLAIHAPDGDRIGHVELPGAVVAVRWSRDGGFAVVATADAGWSVVEAASGDVLRSHVVPSGGPTPVAISRDLSLVAVGWPHHVGLWKSDADEPFATLDGLPKGVYSVAFSDDGRMLAQTGADGVIRVWTLG